MVIVLLVGVLQPVWSATLSEKESLRGLSGIVLKPMVFVSTSSKISDNLPLSDLTEEIQHILHQSGILLDSRTGELSGERPFLEIKGAVTKIVANYYAYTVVVELHQQATLMRNSSHPTVVTWSEGTLSTGDIQNIQKRIRLLVQMFIQDYQHVNATRAPAWFLSWTPSDS